MTDMPTPILVTLILLGVLLSLAALLVFLYLFVLVRPCGRAPRDARLLTDYAHRGLHGNGVPENSLIAFRLAVEGGYGIELDVQLSRDGEVMVFHDYTLDRMTGKAGLLSAHSRDELRLLRLAESDEEIPTLREVLSLVAGRVPLLIELKGESTDTSLCPRLAAILGDYTGPYSVESFNPLLLAKMKKLLPDVYRGQLYTNVVRDKGRASLLNLALTAMALNCLSRPHFIAYNEYDRDSFPVRVTTGLYAARSFVWTVRSPSSLDTAHKNGEYPIFEKIDRE